MRIQKVFLMCFFLLAVTLSLRCAVQIKPLKKSSEESNISETLQKGPKIVFRFFDEDYVSGGYSYNYPEASKVFIPEESGKNGEVAVRFDLEPADYSGGSICLYNLLYDLTPYYLNGALQFWIKGARGGEIAWAALVDEENSDGKKTVVRVPINNYGSIDSQWKQITIPLSDFGKRGVYWDAKKRVEIPERFDWDRVAEFRLEIKKGDNPTFTAWLDDIFVVDGVKEKNKADEDADEQYWDEIEETIEPPPTASAQPVKALYTIFDNELEPGAFVYVYGGKTAYRIQPTGKKENSAVLAMYQDNADYSGVTISLGLGRNLNLEKLRLGKAGLAFWAKASAGVQKAFIGLLDDESDGMKVQTKVIIGDFGKLDTTWKYFMIPLRRFASQGLWWNATKHAEVAGEVRWDRINEFRVSINRYENKIPDKQPAVIYIDQITIIEEIPGYVDPDEYWAKFNSNKPDVLLHDFEGNNSGWEKGNGPKSDVTFDFVDTKDPKRFGKKALKIDYKLADWCDVYYDYLANNSEPNIRNWSQHWALRFWIYTERPYQSITVQINDSGNEVFVANTGGTKGWSEVLVPFRSFNKFPYYQPDDAIQNSRFDLENVRRIDFKPAGDGTSATFYIDNVKLTNIRELEKPKAPEQIAVNVRGSFNKVITESINPGIFGINAALWDADLLKPETEEYVKAVNHGVIRYPGGLRADEDHWKEVLTKKDWMVDTDEFMEFCKKVGATAMITVNFGRGTPQEAADWVRYVNKEKKYDVKLWEIGNELYGDWHPNHCSAEQYGKRAVEFINAMKAVDSTILIGVVWVLDGEWNKTVFEYTKDLADAVIIHHYPQHSGEENDVALLSSPQSLDQIIPSVRKQLQNYGSAQRRYQIWLTEWNSVDFNPGPQTLSIVNGLFVADYLGKLATHNIEQASYWDIHNDITPQGGDYGYLSRTGAVDGDNVPRPSYWAFRLTSEVLRGKLLEASTDNDDVTAYLCVSPSGEKNLLLINKNPQSKALIRLSIDNFSGKAIVKELNQENARKGYTASQVYLNDSTSIILQPYSIKAITLK